MDKNTPYVFVRKFLAFTLAETLIVMGIIGVVAALTIPNLSSSTGEKEKVAKLKKIYQNLDDAYGRATAVYGPITDWGLDGDDKSVNIFWERMLEFLKVSKANKGSSGLYEFDTVVILADGSSVYLNFLSSIPDGSNSYPELEWYGTFQVDIDGPNKGKNKPGHDIFNFSITNQGVLPEDTSVQTGNKPAIKDGNDRYYSASWVIMNENLDYLKCYNKLSWNGNTTCK